MEMTFYPKGVTHIKDGYNVVANNDSAPEPITLEQRIDHVKQLLNNPETDPKELLEYLDRFTNLATLSGLQEDQIKAVQTLSADLVEKLEALGLTSIDEELRRRYITSKNRVIVANNNNSPVLSAA